MKSKPEEGTIFIIDLPASRETPAEESSLLESLHFGAGRVLVMDDDDAVRLCLGDILMTLGYEVQSARDGCEAITLYEAAKAIGTAFDVVLLDLTVTGGMGGREAALKLREIDPSARLIVSSGYSDAEVMANFREHGFDAVMPKPWTAAQVSGVVRNVLETPGGEKALKPDPSPAPGARSTSIGRSSP